MAMHHHVIENGSVSEVTGLISQIILAIPFICALIIYITALIVSEKRGREWRVYRTIFMVSGSLISLSAVVGPLAIKAHSDFIYHMLNHLLLGMLGPLLMVLAAPMTLILRALSVKKAKRVTKILNSTYAQFITNPIVASLLNVGGLGVLYMTNLYNMMHHSLLLHVFIHIHVFLAGYLFTISMIYIDPTPHRRSYLYRTIVFIFALAGHGMLAKQIYANSPAGVPVDQAQTGGMLMYYGGDVVDAVIITILFYQWYQSTAPKQAIKTRALS
ncbi:cytochrome c oxidase assembly protein [Alkalibacillus aidingensis]|uniref:cytochrome c oxidase assembly protein n=1 Tax=Alkalibacillus aidingensis TaxID=2747607 RepID=UPI00166154A5|nr:cytochrome c oxidase assembly protein [Alkalibacillus aidingensis]